LAPVLCSAVGHPPIDDAAKRQSGNAAAKQNKKSGNAAAKQQIRRETDRTTMTFIKGTEAVVERPFLWNRTTIMKPRTNGT
jgi:hypothetical protein